MYESAQTIAPFACIIAVPLNIRGFVPPGCALSIERKRKEPERVLKPRHATAKRC
jgi:hypothetical protein